ncbi:MAG: cyclase family protein [Pseudomonadota bacterium]
MTNRIDLTHTFTDDMPVFPGDPRSKLTLSMTVEKDGFRDEILETGMHVGTHMDAPMHMLEDSFPVSDIPLDQCSGPGILLDVRGQKEITSEHFDVSKLQTGGIVLLQTGWSEKLRDGNYMTDYPVLCKDAAHCFVNAGIKMVVFETPSPDVEPFPIHHILMSNNVLIVENATNFSALESVEHFTIHAYPAKFEASAAPVRIFAEINEGDS